jgi:hypothetical protein
MVGAAAADTEVCFGGGGLRTQAAAQSLRLPAAPPAAPAAGASWPVVAALDSFTRSSGFELLPLRRR